MHAKHFFTRSWKKLRFMDHPESRYFLPSFPTSSLFKKNTMHFCIESKHLQGVGRQCVVKRCSKCTVSILLPSNHLPPTNAQGQGLYSMALTAGAVQTVAFHIKKIFSFLWWWLIFHPRVRDSRFFEIFQNTLSLLNSQL